MLLRSTLSRQCRTLQTPSKLIFRSIPLENSIFRRTFHVCPPSRYADSTSTDRPSSSEATNPNSAETKTAEKTSAAPEVSETQKETPAPSAKREADPKDQQIAELKDKYLRTVAEFRNLQSQTRREVAAAQAYTIQRFSTDLLDTIDILTEALESCPPLPPLETSDPNQKEDILVTEHRNLHEGLKMVEHILMRTIERHGLMTIAAEGEASPPFHEVAGEVEGKDEGRIAKVIKRGYTLNGKILRPAKVAVYKAKSAGEPVAEQATEQATEQKTEP